MKGEELLRWIDKRILDPQHHCVWGTKEDEQIYEQIRAILKNQPTITKKDTRNKSLGKLAEDLKISFSAAKIISDHAQPEITEEWIEEKGDELWDWFEDSLDGSYTIVPHKCRAFIRMLIEDLK